VIAITMPATTNTKIATCIQIQNLGIATNASVYRSTPVGRSSKSPIALGLEPSASITAPPGQ
jgi:hypothetical protein